MSLDTNIIDGHGTKNRARVTTRGQLVTAPLEYSDPYFNAMVVDDQVYSFVPPLSGKQFVITDIIASADKNVTASTGVEIVIYESASVDGVSTKNIITLDINRLGNANIVGLNMITTTGTWINATMDDNNVNLTILGYYVETEE